MKTWLQFPQLPLPEQAKVFDEYFSFTFVRHPFVRFASCYQDKVFLDTREYNETEVIEIRWSQVEVYVLTGAYVVASIISKIAKFQVD